MTCNTVHSSLWSTHTPPWLQEFLDFLGIVKDKKPYPVGSPFQMDFPCEGAPPGVTPYDGLQPTCWDSVLKCSCGDCPDAPSCQAEPSPPPNPTGPLGCSALGLGATSVSCLDVTVLLLGGLLCALLVMLYLRGYLCTELRRLSSTGPPPGQPLVLVCLC